MEVPILKQGHYLIASIQSALTDADLSQLREALIERVGRFRARGVIVDVTALDVMDSFAVRTLRDIAHMARLRGAETVIVGISPRSPSPWSSSASRSRACPPRWISRKACCSSTTRRSSASSVGRDASTVADDLLIPITADTDVVTARQRGRDLAAEAGFSSGDQTVIAAAISEIARNILMYAKRGEVTLGVVTNGDRQGVVIVARDQGPGIRDVERALEDGYSTSGGLGLGLPGARRLMDDFDVSSTVGKGTTVTMKKWRRMNA